MHKESKNIVVKGARENNLKNVNLTIPRDSLTVFTGLSGSGKSTLAFDTIFAEGQRRYLESVSSYARQFLGQMDKPDVDMIEGLSPAISIDQKTTSHNPRSTVGTVTEIHDYMRLLWSKIGVSACPVCGQSISVLSTDEIVSQILDTARGAEVKICAPVVRDRKGTYLKLFSDMWDRGFLEAYVNGVLYDMQSAGTLTLDRYKKHNIDVVVDTIVVTEEHISRLFEAVEMSLRMAEGLVHVRRTDTPAADTYVVYNQKYACPTHPEVVFPELEPRLFSFNSPFGACPACEGLGMKKEVDLSLVVPDETLTIAQGGMLPWSNKKKSSYYGAVLHGVLQHYHIPDNVRIKDLSERHREIVFYGDTDPDPIAVRMHSAKGSTLRFSLYWRGIVGFLRERYQKSEAESVLRDIEQYMSRTPCSTCGGSRYKEEALWIKIGGKNIDEVSQMTIGETIVFFETLQLNTQEKIIGERIIKEIVARLHFLQKVGLGYLMLSRAAYTLSGGESQRIRLASQIGSQLMGVLYILDEPSIGLHARDNSKLLETLLYLRDLGNTVIVIEHDEETMRAADFLVDIGPGAGKHGGSIVAAGTPAQVLQSRTSPTAQYLRGDKTIPVPAQRHPIKGKKMITVRGARENNLQNITAEFPVGMLTVVTGVSGSGKSTLVEEILYKGLSHTLMRSTQRPGKHRDMIGVDALDKVIMVDQSPIGRTPRSNPATYTGVFTAIRELFAQTKAAKARGYQARRFSFNVPGGRCDNCKGDGSLKIEMQFMADVYLPCDVCHGTRYNSETLQITYRGKTIADVLAMTVDEAVDFFDAYPAIRTIIATLQDVGLGYIHLGQSATTLSGGEAQRVKLATELARKATGSTMYILDEPTTGLHFDDVAKLLHVLQRLVDAGNSVVVIEHNMDVIKTADWIIDMGPEGGSGGGTIIAAGTPEEIIKYHKESYTAKYLRDVLKKK